MTPTRTLKRSCEECRRRKLKCDRTVPCSKCLERGCSELCPDGVLASRSDKYTDELVRLRSRVRELEDRLHNIVKPPRATAAESAGTLTLRPSGAARFVGPSAASEWLSEVQDGDEHPASDNRSAFPFDRLPSGSPARTLLPTRDEAEYRVAIYYDLYAFNYDVVSRTKVDGILNSLYSDQATHGHRLALLFMILAMGCLLDPDGNTQSCDVYFEAAQQSLMTPHFLKDNTVAAVQTLHIMANYHLYADRFRGSDRSWSLGGMAMRLIMAMGLHRDGEAWGLSEEDLQERRLIFWETHTEETFQAHCFGRPGPLFSRHFDVRFPHEDPTQGFHLSRYELVNISNDALDGVLCMGGISYRAALEHFDRVMQLRADLLPIQRWKPCETGSGERWLLMPPQAREIIKLELRRHTLALNICETSMFLFRPFFVRALREQPADPTKAEHGRAFEIMFDECKMIIAIASSLYRLHRPVALPHWFFWYHASSAAVCMASVPLLAPQSPLAVEALAQLNIVCNMFSPDSISSKSNAVSLTMILRLRNSATTRLFETLSLNQPEGAPSSETFGLMGIETCLRDGRVEQVEPQTQSIFTTLEAPPLPDLDTDTFAYLSSMGPSGGAAPPVDYTGTQVWDDLDRWFGFEDVLNA